MKQRQRIALLCALACPAVFAQEAPPTCSQPKPVLSTKDKASIKTSADQLQSYLRAFSDNLPTGGAAGCTTELKKALADAATPVIAQAGGDGLLDAIKQIKDTADNIPSTVDTLAVQALAAAGGVKVFNEQKIDPVAARYDFYAGPSYSLTPDGSWNNGVEVLFRSNTGRLMERDGFFNYFQVSSLFAYRTLGGDKDVNLNDEGEGETDPLPEFVSPFDAETGVASVDLRGTGFFYEAEDKKSAVGFSLLGGAESLPLEDDDSALTTLKARGGLGGLYRTSYGDGALGELFVGYIHDSRYQAKYTGEDEDSTNRLALSGILQLPSFNKEGSLRLAARIFASTPISGGNASELRLSVLVAYDLRSVFSKL